MDDAIMPFKHVQQQRRSARGRRRLLFTNLFFDFNTSLNAQFTRHQTGDDNQSTNTFCEEGSVAGKGKSVGASRCSLETEIEGVTAICGTGDQSAANSPLDMKRTRRRQAISCQRFQSEGARAPIICSRLNDDADSATCEGVAVGSWFPGQLVWAKLCRFPWWPAQVMDERSVDNGSRPQRLSKDDILVRFFGIYNFAWVDPLMNLSKFDMNFEERSRILKKAFQKGLKEALEYRDSRRLPDNWTMAMQAQNAEESDIKPNGIEFSGDSNSHEKAKLDGLYRAGAARKRKPKMLYEVCSILWIPCYKILCTLYLMAKQMTETLLVRAWKRMMSHLVGQI
ncbi:hypothetical protein O6H91_14G074100 [Diphasiastrum complanatum]|uniref:Uncharacterized protein n=1 Tax=Diphasiastrum complanatum TaxID=34168 RepID=A0ACC2BR34_DIPCM|nr:hypothetical protein O6H91_14G074100 [Diphasiastrum complanatum]